MNSFPIMSVCAAVSFFRNDIGEECACLGIDIQAARPAPIGKRFGVDIGAHDGMSIAAQLLLSSFGFHPPFVESSGELVAIGHDPADGAVIFGTVPNHASCSDDLSHEVIPSC